MDGIIAAIKNAMAVLNSRYVAGEMNKDSYESMMSALDDIYVLIDAQL
jgi:uncharacterized membrane protein